MMHKDTNTHLPVMEHFYTLQGEGVHTGKAAYFIRLAGCDVGCHWCDVKASWEVNDTQWLPISEIVEYAARYPARLAVITGGEPLMYDISALVDALHGKGFLVNIETSGAYPVTGTIDWICVSPKKFMPPLPDTLAAAHEFKVIVSHASDFLWAQQFLPLLNNSCTLLLQPEWDKQEKYLPDIILFIKDNPNWKLSLQTHKYLNIP